MGVPGLWDILNKAGTSRSLKHLAVVDGFNSNKSDKRGYRLGIDASIWFYHASFTPQGENPALRCLFFKLVRLAELPILPLFVFDGRLRPKIKRGSKMGKSGSHTLIADFKVLLDAFGMQWRQAQAEAEAELASLNCRGFIDAVLSDDVDLFVFGATTVVKNWSVTLSGNKSSPALDHNGKTSKFHVNIYHAKDIESHPDIKMTRGGLVLFALLCGGDYDRKGVDKIGPVTAHALARCNFGDLLLNGYSTKKGPELQHFLAGWIAAVNNELHTNAHGYMRNTSKESLPSDFPDLDILEYYANPISTASGGQLLDKGQLNLPKIAAFCENKFEWGYRSHIIKRFRDLMWGAAVMHVLRRASLETDEKHKIQIGAERNYKVRGPLQPRNADAVGTPAGLVKRYLSSASSDSSSNDRRRAAFANQEQPRPNITTEDIPDPHPLFVQIVNVRSHVSTDELPEYCVEIDPRQLIAFVNSGIKGTRRELPAKELKNPAPEPTSVYRMWLPTTMVHQIHPQLVEAYTMGEQQKKSKRKRVPASEPSGTAVPDVPRPRRTARNNQITLPRVSGAPVGPWFTSGTPSNDASSSIWISNPDGEDVGDNSDTEMEQPPSFMDDIFEQVMNPRKRPTKPRAPHAKKRARPSETNDHEQAKPPPKKRQRQSASKNAKQKQVERSSPVPVSRSQDTPRQFPLSQEFLEISTEDDEESPTSSQNTNLSPVSSSSTLIATPAASSFKRKSSLRRLPSFPSSPLASISQSTYSSVQKRPQILGKMSSTPTSEVIDLDSDNDMDFPPAVDVGFTGLRRIPSSPLALQSTYGSVQKRPQSLGRTASTSSEVLELSDSDTDLPPVHVAFDHCRLSKPGNPRTLHRQPLGSFQSEDIIDLT